jgi:hypothetical protein
MLRKGEVQVSDVKSGGILQGVIFRRGFGGSLAFVLEEVRVGNGRQRKGGRKSPRASRSSWKEHPGSGQW